jgi:YhhN-like protein.
MKQAPKTRVYDIEERTSKLNKFFPYIYFALVAYCCVLEFQQYKKMLVLTKPLVMVLLLTNCYNNIRKKLSPFGVTVLIGFFFSGLADMIYTGNHSNELYFGFGMGIYIVTRFIQGASFGINVYNGTVNTGALFGILYALPYIVWNLIIFFIVKGKLGDLQIIIAAFLASSAFMGILSVMRNNHTTGVSFKYALIGSALVAIYDSMLVISHFYKWKDNWIGPFMAAIAYTGHYLIVQGVNHHILYFDVKEKKLLSESLFSGKKKAE